MAKYKFIGKDGSMGYRTGEIYRGSLEDSIGQSVVFVPGIFPLNLFSKKPCIPYSSLAKFYENWQTI